ncbi:MAG TPA: hypothetical protein VLT16_07090, partial [Candidatus Limnocylindrales bacterium]|nr:hypothetical protein [Candidatus Limnocylindrales bacterium]
MLVLACAALTAVRAVAQVPKPPAPGQGAVMSNPAVAKPRPGYQYPIGKTYVYSAQWRIFDAGIATLRME